MDAARRVDLLFPHEPVVCPSGHKLERNTWTAGELPNLVERCKHRPLQRPLQLIYQELLSQELTTEEFTAAIRIAVRDSAFWPSPKQLIEFVHPPRDLELEGAKAFDKLLDKGERISGISGQTWRKETVLSFGESAYEAFKIIGGNDRLRSIAASDLPFARREFVTAYKSDAEERARNLAAMKALSDTNSPLLVAPYKGQA